MPRQLPVLSLALATIVIIGMALVGAVGYTIVNLKTRPSGGDVIPQTHLEPAKTLPGETAIRYSARRKLPPLLKLLPA